MNLLPWKIHLIVACLETGVLLNTSIYMNMQINKVREFLGELPTEMPDFLSDATIRRFLHARNWSVVQATKSLKEAVKWRRQYKPEKICWVSIVIVTAFMINIVNCLLTCTVLCVLFVNSNINKELAFTFYMIGRHC